MYWCILPEVNNLKHAQYVAYKYPSGTRVEYMSRVPIRVVTQELPVPGFKSRWLMQPS